MCQHNFEPDIQDDCEDCAYELGEDYANSGEEGGSPYEDLSLDRKFEEGYKNAMWHARGCREADRAGWIGR